MLTIRRILFPTDFSEGSTRAFAQAVFLADQHDAALHIIHVAEGGATATDEPFPVATDTLAEWMQASADSSSELDRLSIVQKIVDSDTAAEAICAYASEHEIDLAVMGTQGRRGTDRMIFGSVAEEVVREAPCPVLTVRAGTDIEAHTATERILTPIDFSDFSKAAARHAREIGAAYDASIHLLHVVDVPEPPPPHVDPDNYPEPAVLDQAKLDLEKLAEENIGHDRVTVAAEGGDASEVILEYVDEHDIDFIVIATKGRTGLDRMLLGSVAEEVLSQSPVPVFVVKPNRRSLTTTEASSDSA